MELGLLQLALTHLLAAKAVSWVLGWRGHRQDRATLSSRTSAINNKQTNVQNARLSHRRGRQSRQKRLTNSKLRRKGAIQGDPDLASTVTAVVPFASASAINHVSSKSTWQGPDNPPTARMLAGNTSATPLGRRSDWAVPRAFIVEDDDSCCQQPQLYKLRPPEQRSHADNLLDSGSSSRPTARVNASCNAFASQARPWICLRRQQHRKDEQHQYKQELLQQTQSGDPILGWHLGDEPPLPQQQQQSEETALGMKSLATVTDAVMRLFGGGGDSDGDAVLQPPQPPGRGTTTPHFVGSHPLGDDGGGGCSGIGIGLGGGGGAGSGSAAAAAAASLSSAGGALGVLAERAVEAPVRGLREFNRKVTAGVSDFLASDSGRRLSEQVAAEMSTGALMAPVYLTEELVKARVKSLLRSHAVWLATFLSLRVSLATAVLHCSKDLLTRSVRKRGPRWLRCVVHFLCDVLLPTSFFGPLLGLTAAALQLTGVPGPGLGQGLGWLRGGQHHQQTAAPMQPPLATALPAVAAAAGDAVAATVSATVAATVTPAVAATANWGSGK